MKTLAWRDFWRAGVQRNRRSRSPSGNSSDRRILSSSLCTSLRLCERVHSVPRAFELPLLGKLLPDLLAELVGRRDGDDRGGVAAAQGTAADSRLVIELSQLEPFAKRLERRLEFLRSWADRRCGV